MPPFSLANYNAGQGPLPRGTAGIIYSPPEEHVPRRKSTEKSPGWFLFPFPYEQLL